MLRMGRDEIISEPRKVQLVKLAPCTVQEKYMDPNLEKLKRCEAIKATHRLPLPPLLSFQNM